MKKLPRERRSALNSSLFRFFFLFHFILIVHVCHGQSDTLALNNCSNDTISVKVSDILIYKHTTQPSVGIHSEVHPSDTSLIQIIGHEYKSKNSTSVCNGGDITYVYTFFKAVSRGETEILIQNYSFDDIVFEQTCRIRVD